MKYKTVIEIVSDAADRNEAVDIAGEYLSGNIMSGVRMKCRTKASYTYKVRNAASIVIVALMVAVGVLLGMQTNHYQGNPSQRIAGIDAIQPPLKTSAAGNNDSNFKKAWQDVQTREALSYIKK